MARKKSKTRRSRPAFSILNALESLTYAEILSRGITGGGVWSFITSDADVKYTAPGVAPSGLLTVDSMGGYSNADGQITLSDLMKEPGFSIGSMANQFQANLVPMAASAFGVSVGFKIGKRLLRMPINNINRNLIRPALGKSVRL